MFLFQVHGISADHCIAGLYDDIVLVDVLVMFISFQFIWGVPKMGVPPNGWLKEENPTNTDDLGVPLFQETSISYVLDVTLQSLHVIVNIVIVMLVVA